MTVQVEIIVDSPSVKYTAGAEKDAEKAAVDVMSPEELMSESLRSVDTQSGTQSVEEVGLICQGNFLVSSTYFFRKSEKRDSVAKLVRPIIYRKRCLRNSEADRNTRHHIGSENHC